MYLDLIFLNAMKVDFTRLITYPTVLVQPKLLTACCLAGHRLHTAIVGLVTDNSDCKTEVR